ncbi:cell division ATP-binding protein FtsE [Candidatus Gracilibacteria bacterium]|nr:cell division ATP-binding protein FtsE [Thermales bacterium]NJL97224.1 cell division ATP-binding protein FtsE [Candidatus Gracilibacteria bacterium]NJS40884.1 cell division ATP-binding protein FtsE [Candidatus Gracilibacteria bacterium]
MIKYQNVSKQYGKDSNSALKNVNLEIKAGEFVSFIGASGAGKSTLLKMLIGEAKPDRGGEIWIEDIRVDKIKSEFMPYLRRRIGVIFQDFKLLPSRTVYENVSLAMEVAGANKEEIKRDVPKLLDLVGIVAKSDRYPNELSGGEKQRVSIARALSHNPILLIADEPTGNLDKANTYEIITLLLKIHNSGTTVLLATHDQEVVDKLKKRVITIQDGEVVLDQEVGMYYI